MNITEMTKEELGDAVLRELGYKNYPTDSVEQGEMWHLADGPPDSASALCKRYVDPTDAFKNGFFVKVLMQISDFRPEPITTDGEKRCSARGSLLTPWRKGPVGIAVCQAYLDIRESMKNIRPFRGGNCIGNRTTMHQDPSTK